MGYASSPKVFPGKLLRFLWAGFF